MSLDCAKRASFDRIPALRRWPQRQAPRLIVLQRAAIGGRAAIISRWVDLDRHTSPNRRRVIAIVGGGEARVDIGRILIRPALPDIDPVARADLIGRAQDNWDVAQVL